MIKSAKPILGKGEKVMSSEQKCIFCGSEITDNQPCSWCGFSQEEKGHLPGTLAFGTDVNGFVVGDVVDMDGESTSYLAYDRDAQRKVILKEFLPVSMVAPRAGDVVKVQQGKEVLFKNLMMDFTDLYSTLIKVESKSLQKIHSIFSANGTVYAVLEYIKGDNLRQNLIKRGKPYTFKEARWLFQDLFVLMQQLEKLNIAHGGISDETVMITPENTAVLTGFAIRDLRVKNEHIMYKLYEGFSAPEQYSLNQFAGFYTDIYSVSALFFHAVTGREFSPQALELKDIAKYMPKYAVQALKYATKPNPQDRIDNIGDFMFMLDNKATIEKPVSKKPASDSKKDMQQLKKFAPFVAVAAILLVFLLAVFSINPQDEESLPQSSEETPVSSYVNRVEVPYVVGKTYSEVMNDPSLTQYLFFNVTEEFSDDAPVGQIIRQQPQSGTSVSRGAVVYVTVSKGPEQKKVQMPYGLVGRPLSEVQALLDAMGISYTTKDVPQTAQYSHGTVTGTDIPEGVMIDPTEVYVIIYVADNTPVVTIPAE